MDLGAALLAILSAVLVKGAVMVLAGFMIVRVYRATHRPAPRRLWRVLPDGERGGESRILFWALTCFAISELTCGVEIYVIARSSVWLEGFHGLVSATGMSLFALGMYQFFDRKVVRFTEPGCVAHRICGTCTVRAPEGCKMRLSLLLVATLVVLGALLPLLASTARMDANLHRFTLPFPSLNAWYDGRVVPFLAAHVPGYQPSGSAFYFPRSILVLELRIIPLVAAGLGVAAIVSLRSHRLLRGTSLLMLAVGALAYSYFELLLYRGTGDLLIGSLGHEVGELWFVIFTVEFLGRAYAKNDSNLK